MENFTLKNYLQNESIILINENDLRHNDTIFNNDFPVTMTPSTMRICLWTICIIGIVLNLGVFRRNNYLRKRQNSNVRNSLQLLCFMAIADTISLAALMLVLSTQYLGIESFTIVAAICKIDLFLIHSASAFSIWCWLVLSAMRYLAVYRPYSHLKLNKEPILTTFLIFVTCCTLELWILFDVTFIIGIKNCGETMPDNWSKAFQLAEIIWSYFLPLTLITVLDIKVLFCHSTWSSEKRETSLSSNTQEIHNNSTMSEQQILTNNVTMLTMPTVVLESKGLNNKKFVYKPRFGSNRRAQQLKILKRCLCISILDLGMNLPNYLIRLYLALVPDEDLDQINNAKIFLWIQDISQLLYFAQFSLNALYLFGIIYVSRSQTSKKVSINCMLSMPSGQYTKSRKLEHSKSGKPKVNAVYLAKNNTYTN